MVHKMRYRALDALRGFALLNMMLYHGLWDVVYLFGRDISWFTSSVGFVWQQCICWTFILLSGFCWSLGSKKLKRGLMVLGVSVIITAVTLIFMPDAPILFGVLTLLGSAMLLMLPLKGVLQKVPVYFGLSGSFILFLLTKNVNEGFLGFFGYEWIRLPEGWYTNLFTAYLGFRPRGFWSADYFSLIPWFFLYVTGYFLYRLFEKKQWLSHLTSSVSRPLEWLGRHSLWVYVLHQPILYGLYFVVFRVL